MQVKVRKLSLLAGAIVETYPTFPAKIAIFLIGKKFNVQH